MAGFQRHAQAGQRRTGGGQHGRRAHGDAQAAAHELAAPAPQAAGGEFDVHAHALGAGLFDTHLAHQARGGAVADPGRGFVCAPDVELQHLPAAGHGHGPHRVGLAGRQRHGDGVALGAAGGRHVGEGGVRPHAAGRRSLDRPFCHPGRGVGRQLHAQAIAPLAGHLQHRAGGQLGQIRATQAHVVQAVQQVRPFRPGDHQTLRVGAPHAHAAEGHGLHAARPRAAGQGGAFQPQIDRGRFHVARAFEAQQGAVVAGRDLGQRLPVLAGQPRLHLLAGCGAHSHLDGFTGRHPQQLGRAQAAAVKPQAVVGPDHTGRWRGALDLQHTLQRLPSA